MEKYHINGKGVPAICKATIGKCPFGGEENHFPSLESAQKRIDEIHEEEHGILNITEQQLFKKAETKEELKYIEDRIRELTLKSKKVRRNSGRLQDGHYIEKCKESEMVENIHSENYTEHLEIERADRMSRVKSLFGEGKVIASFDINHYIKRFNGYRFAKQSLSIRDNGRISMYNRGDTREITSFQAAGARIEAVFLRAGFIPDQSFIEIADRNREIDERVSKGENIESLMIEFGEGKKENTSSEERTYEEYKEQESTSTQGIKTQSSNRVSEEELAERIREQSISKRRNQKRRAKEEKERRRSRSSRRRR